MGTALGEKAFSVVPAGGGDGGGGGSPVKALPGV